MSVEHYENFPVASWLCPPALRPAVVAIYHFARTADDLADEGDDPPEARLAALTAFRAELSHSVALASSDTNPADATPTGPWPAVFGPLRAALRAYGLPPRLLHDLLDAFEQDVHNPTYPDRTALLGYCRRSADPVGRLLLHLYGVSDPTALQQSDAICSALQLINFWQDLGRDRAHGRCYVPDEDLARHGLSRDDLRPGADTPATRALVADLCAWARHMMEAGAPLARRLPGRAGWELRLVVQGGLRILEKIAHMDHAALSQRPTLGALDSPRLLWRAVSWTPPAPVATAR